MPVSCYLCIFLNVRLGAGSPPIGIPFFWPSSVMPNTVMDEWSDMVFLKWNGASFSAATYPKLAKVVPGLILTDTRGEFIRVWDDGRGVDPTTGRALLSWQGDLFKTHSHKLYISAVANASGTNSSDVGSQYESSLVSPYRTLDEGGRKPDLATWHLIF